MKIKRHTRRPDIKEVVLSFDPLTVWLNPSTELTIERGDRLGRVALKVQKVLDVPEATALTLAAYYFAVGERLAAAGDRPTRPWKRKELRTNPKRRYLRGERTS